MNFGALDTCRRLLVLLMATGLVLGVFYLSGCDNSGTGEQVATPEEPLGLESEIPLNTLAQGVYSEYGRFDEVPMPSDAPPECMIITDGEEYQRLLSLSSLQETPPTVDFTSDIVITAMQGPKNTGGYAISIMYADQAGDEVRVEVDVVIPDPGAMSVQVLTSPYHLVIAKRSDFDPRGKVFFTFVDQKDNLINRQGADL
jgi:hypothetical protein